MEVIHQRLQTLRLLIVEDDESTLKWLIRVLAIYFKEVKGAKDALEGLEFFNEQPFDVVISDIQMPYVDGLHLLQKIGLISPKTLRIAMSAFNTPTYLNRAVESEVHFYFKKPIDIDEFLVAVASKNFTKEEKLLTVSLGEEYFYDYEQKIVQYNGVTIKLTKKEILLLEFLLSNKNAIVTMEQIEKNIWEEPISNEAIRMVIAGIRKKLYPSVISNLKGIGYKLM